MRTHQIFARLEQEPQRPDAPVPGMSRVRRSLLGAILAFYGVIVAAVLSTSWLVRIDWQVMLFRPYKQWPEVHAFLDYFVVLGQRGPTAVLIAAWLGWRSWRQRTLRPLLIMGAALLLLNVTVGAAKIGMGREGPHYANVVGSNEMFLTGDIFPSGHTANAVVTWGILAYLATTPQARRVLSVIAAVFALGVGATTVYLGTHWVSDVLLGWAAGLLVLLALPWCEPLIARAEVRILTLRDRLRARLVPGTPDSPAGLPPLASQPLHPVGAALPDGPPARRGDPEPVTAGVARRTGPRLSTARLRAPERTHPVRADRPGRPVGSH
ncbi:phosphatase PAP2 family protein [Streptomyces sp. ACA25]|uniref:phosphatase PAP2 family protein n=1 Tax=Streptomyces sp. ACA25 TaxID=3022596 RepID=UPI002307780A|nr:phosphatase PAP2 family protein [Streptomyces sp. ACA25]MDB1089112.1 phosphatase PAP2 family protein [Streptomyces sp. ACA25]